MTEPNDESPRQGALISGPYLLAPRHDGVVIAWESDTSTDWTLDVWPQSRTETEPWSQFAPSARIEEIEGEQCTLLSSYIDGLAPETEHRYRIVHGGEPVGSGSFRTLSPDRSSARLFLLADSHMFTTSERIQERIAAFGPDFAVHCGDIPAGTGLQKEQYTEGWFAKISETLHNVPFVYVPGNHDDGPYFDFYFRDQTQELSHDPTGRSYSVDHGGVHMALVDSNSWGLSEMNAVNSAIPVSTSIRSRISSTLAWLREDLSSDAARRARWKIVVLHHPYTDEFTNRHVVPIVEEAGVDLLVGAHLHEYIKAVSLEQAHGGRPVYLTLPSAQQPECGYRTGGPGSRLMSEFPEVVATGNGNYATLEADSTHLLIEVFGFRADSHRQELVDRVVLGDEPAQAELHQVTVEEDAGEHVALSVMVRGKAVNKTRHGVVASVAVLDNGEKTIHVLDGTDPDSTRVIYLDPGEQASFSMRHRLTGVGRHTIRIGDTDTQITVPEGSGVDVVLRSARLDPQRSHVELLAELTNTSPHDTAVSLLAHEDGTPVASRRVSLRGDSVESLHLILPNPGPGDHQFSVSVEDDASGSTTPSSGSLLRPRTESESVSVAIDDALVLTPLVRDRSGHGNDAILRGHPSIIEDEDGARYVRFDRVGDYLEIPPSPSLVLPDGYVAGVRSRVDRLAEPGEMAHNPMMVRGKGVGWGATYFIRMVIDRTGTMKWGTCHGATEYGWAGGAARVGSWTDYLLAFDRHLGGRSFLDGELVSEVPGIGDDALNGYTEEPVFVGYSRIGHVIPEISMPKYITQLWGCVADVRLAGPGAFQASAQRGTFPQEDLRVLLDFSDIVYTGTHVTQWRRPRMLRASYLRDFDRWRPVALRTTAEIPPGSAITMRVETSDDADTVLHSTTVDLSDGVDEFALGDLPPAQYTRVVTQLTGGESSGRVQTPKVRRIAVDCDGQGVCSSLSWSTDSDWRSGQFEGAVGVEPADRLRVFDQYTDVIHG